MKAPSKPGTSRARAKKKPPLGPPSFLERAASSFDDPTVERMCEMHALGSFWKTCLDSEGLSESGWHEAKKREPRYALAQQRAHAAGVACLEKRRDSLVRNGPKGEWKALTWQLERYDREAFAPPVTKSETKGELTGKDGAPLLPTPSEAKAELAKRLEAMSPEERELAERLLAR